MNYASPKAIIQLWVSDMVASTFTTEINRTAENEKCITGWVKDIFFRSRHHNLKNPAIIMAGEVVNRISH